MKAASFQVCVGTFVPIHQQLISQIRDRVAGGLLVAGDELPSVRELSSELVINPMTVSKAYSQLVAQGILERRRGARMAVSGRCMPLPELSRAASLEPSLVSAAERARDLQIGVFEATRLFNAVLQTVFRKMA